MGGEDSQCHLLFNSPTIECHCPGIAAPGVPLTGFPFNPDSIVIVKLHTRTEYLTGSEKLQLLRAAWSINRRTFLAILFFPLI